MGRTLAKHVQGLDLTPRRKLKEGSKEGEEREGGRRRGEEGEGRGGERRGRDGRGVYTDEPNLLPCNTL